MKKVYLIAIMVLVLLLGQVAQAGDVSVTGTPSNRYPSATVDSDNDGQINYILEPNLWNILSSSSGQIVMTWRDASGLSVDIQVSNITQEDPAGWVHAYPEIWHGAKAWNTLGPANDAAVSLPQRLGAMNDFQTTCSYNVTRTDQHYNVPLETWLTNDTSRGSVQSNDVEFMIWMDYVGCQPYGSQIGSVTIGGRSYEMWYDDAVGNGSWEGFAFRPTSPSRSGTVTFNWGAFIQAAQPLSRISNWSNLYFTAVELGTEFGTPDYLQTSLAWSCSQLSCATTSNPMLGGTSTTTTAGTTTTATTSTTAGTSTSTTATTTTTTTATSTTTTTATTTTTTGTTSTTSTASGQTCSPVDAAISAGFTKDGAGTFCWTATSGSYINSWNLSTLTVNGVNYTNTYVFTSQFPAKINGNWYIYYNGSYGWSHFELK